jgi:uncharacterized membrane protein YbhN (UPF0104 family)
MSALVALGIILIVLGLVHTQLVGGGELNADVSRWAGIVPRGLWFLVAVVSIIGTLTLVIVALAVLVRTEARGALTASVATATAVVVSSTVATVWRSERGSVDVALLHGHNPSVLVVDTALVAFFAASDLVRRPRWSRWCVGALAALIISGVGVGALTPLAALVVLFGGALCGWGIRWMLGAASVQPSMEELRARFGTSIPSLRELLPAEPGGGRLYGTLADGTTIQVRLANRDTRGSGVARRLWELVRLRPVVAGHISLSSRSQLERAALVSFLARDAGVLAPEVLLLAELPPETLVLVLAEPRGRRITDAVDLEAGEQLFRALRALHDAGVAHRDLRPGNLLCSERGGGFSSLDAAVPGAGELVRLLDVTQLLTTLGRYIGAPDAVKALRDAYQPVDEDAIASILQPIALAPWGWSEMRAARGCVAEVRAELVGAHRTAPGVRLERFRWRTVLSAIALTIAAFVLVGQLSKVNLLGALGQMDPAWFALAIAGSALTYFAAAENLAAFVPRRLSAVRGFFVQLSSAFVGVAMPPTAGHVAVNARYLQREGVDEGSIAAAVTLSQVINVVTTVVLLITIGLLTGSGISRFKLPSSADVLVAVGALAAVIGIVLLVPALRRAARGQVWPRLRSAWPRLLEAASQPLRLAAGVGSNLLLTFGYAVAFIAALHALGAHPAILPTVAVYLAGNAVGAVAPTPGGLGTVEAVLSAGLAAVGVPAHQAIPAVLIFRAATFWLPIPLGWISFVLLQRREIL